MAVQSQPGKIVLETLFRKYQHRKRTRVSQVVEHLSTTCEALSSNPSTTKKKKRLFTLGNFFNLTISDISKHMGKKRQRKGNINSLNCIG
jgi:hypothetical protein